MRSASASENASETGPSAPSTTSSNAASGTATTSSSGTVAPSGIGSVPTTAHPKTPFLPSLEGLRAIACSGIIITHVAFQTGTDTGSLINQIMARTDFFVPVFFALSGFLLWRRQHVQFRNRRGVASYYVKRLGRIMPAAWVMMLFVFLFLPVADNPSAKQIVENLLMAQVYFADGLVGGMTHLWSLSVELTFYLVLPLIALLIGKQPRWRRVLVIAALGLISYYWAFLPPFTGELEPGRVNPHTMPPAFAAWFAIGFLSAEAEAWVLGTPERSRRLVAALYRLRPLFWLIALAALVAAAMDGPQGLVQATPAEFARRTIYGTVFAAALITPYALAPRSAFLESAPMQALGRWSYAIFLWHIAILSVVFPLLGVPMFSGNHVHTVIVMIATFVLTVPVAALSYALVEEPARVGINKMWAKYTASTTASSAS
ncbi:acyltransferase [Corynebacterium sp. UMB9976]|uniref:acyltransferase family protein n=1 Tax=Corynebacterium sp. UMB9976 TaxID=3046354 RepID=UPI0025518E47|nr:acyltransferase [Corynebacterium sp. UMB9976]MDK6301913.1 acyltransferase [Corynebacterium sp. UMB9976]